MSFTTTFINNEELNIRKNNITLIIKRRRKCSMVEDKHEVKKRQHLVEIITNERLNMTKKTTTNITLK